MNLGFVLLYEDDSPCPPASDNVKAPDALFPPDIAVYTTISPVILGLISRAKAECLPGLIGLHQTLMDGLEQ